MVLQDTWLFHGTLRDNIAYGRENATEEEIVNASGGPQRGIPTKHLKATREQRDQEFLNFDGPWAENAAKTKTVKVNLWKTDLTKT